MRTLISFLFCLSLAAGCSAQSVGSVAAVTVIDRDSGAVLSPYYYRGEYWVAGRPGARYAIQIHNRGGGRLLAVTSVDGVNVLSGETAGWDQSGYVFGPGLSYQITGWRKSDTEVADFTFTASSNSYAERTGRPANVGVIGVAVFRERPPAAYAPAPVAPSAGLGGLDESQSRLAAQAQASTPAPASPSAGNDGVDESRSRPQASMAAPAPSLAGADRIDSRQALSAMTAPKLGTGHGEREWSVTYRTEFQRMQTRPDEVIRIRYDSLENLFAMGIVKRPRPTFPGIDPFPASPDPQYVPDPAG